MKNKLIKFIFILVMVFTAKYSFAAWSNLATGISYTSTGAGKTAAIFYAGCGAGDTGTQNWSDALYNTKLKDKGVGYLYAVRLLPNGNSDGNCSSGANITPNSKIITDLSSKIKAGEVTDIIVIMHSSGAFTAQDFLKQVVNKNEFNNTITAFNIDGANINGIALKKTYLVRGTSSNIKSLNYDAGIVANETVNLTLPAGCTTAFCAHMRLINGAATGSVNTDYINTSVTNVTNSYLDKITSGTNNIKLGNNVNTDTQITATAVGQTDFSPSSYELISPIGNLSKIDDQDKNGFSGFINLIIVIAIALAGAIAVITIIVSGIQYMGTDSVWEKGESKMKISTAVGGIVLLLCSYIILNTINPDLVNIKIGGMKRINDAEWDRAPRLLSDGTYSAPPTGSKTKGCTALIDGKKITNGMSWPTAKQNTLIEELKKNNIFVTSSSGKMCTKVGEGGCTAMYFNPGAEPIVKEKLISLQKKVGESITITGGSECWLHSTHGPDDPILDIQISSQLNKTITGNANFTGGNKWTTLSGIGEFLAEGAGGTAKNTGAHWHVILK